MSVISTHEAKTHLSRYLAEVERGGEFVIARGRHPVARLVPIGKSRPRPRPKVGRTTGSRFTVPAAAFAPLGASELKSWGL